MQEENTTRNGKLLLIALTTFLLAVGCVESNPQPSPGGGKGGNGQITMDCAGDAYAPQDGSVWPQEDMSADLPKSSEIVSYADSSMVGDYTGADASNPPWAPDNPGGCAPSCDAKQCGPDGCGGTCGWCSASGSCQDGVCVDVPGCTPDCATQMIGEDDGCGGVCTGGGFGIGLKPGGAQDVGYFRHLVDEGEVPEAALFPIEGFLNEHDTALPAPDFDMFATLHAFLGMLYDPQADKPLIAMQIGLNSAVSPEAIESKHFNLVVVVDKSGSMGSAGKLDFVKAGLLLMLNTLDEDDTLAIVTYSDNAEVACGPTPVAGYNKGHLVDVITGIQASGSTNLYAGMVEGYELAKMNINKPNTISRILLLSDGLISAGEHNFDVILAKSAQYNEAGIGITTVGVGTEFNQNLMYQLASQGNGNFYFLEDGEKLVDVFDYELVYLLTPVAENLKISFRLPEGFFVEEIYGFDFQELDDGEIVLLGPAPQYSVTPPDQGGGDNPDPDAGNVAIPTLFASKKNGILMVRLGVQQTSIFDAWEALDFAEITYSYDLADTGETESATKTVVMGSLSYFEEDDPDSELAFFTGPIMQRNFCILRMALGVKEACALYHNIPQDVGGAIIQLADAMTFCKGINFTLNDSVIDEDIELLEALKDNICAGADCMPSQ